jgi:hypothetical protein
MRLPGFSNVKREPHVSCFIVDADAARQYESADLTCILQHNTDATSQAGNDSSLDNDSFIRRARAYTQSIPNEREGARNQAAFRLAAALVNDFGLREAVAGDCLNEWNAGNKPPLDEKELAGVLESAKKYAKKPLGSKVHDKTFVASVASVAHEASEEHIETDPWPDALDEASFHGLAGELVRLIEPHSEADPAALLIQALVAFGNVIGRSAFFRAEADMHYGNLFTCLVGLTSKGRKGSSWGQTSRLLAAVDAGWANNRVLGGLSSGEGLIWAVRDPIYKKEPVREGGGKGRGKGRIVGYEDVLVDPGVADKRLLVLEAEFGSVLKVIARERNTLSAIIRQAWDIGALRTLTKNAPAQATGAHISIVGHITRNELRRQICETDMANGLANRFLWLCVKRSKCLPEGGQLHNVDFEPEINSLLDAVLFARDVHEVRRNDEARLIWREVYRELSEGKAGLLGAATSRAESQVMRLAMLYALLDRTDEISGKHLLAALALWQYAEQSARYIFGSSLGDPTADELLRALKAKLPGGMTRTEMRDHFGKHKSSEEIGRALGVLLDDGRVYKGKSEATGGRRAEVWFAMH